MIKMDGLFTSDYKLEPYWWERTPRPSAKDTAPPGEADVAIVGSGYTGPECRTGDGPSWTLDSGVRCGGRRLWLQFPQWWTDQHQYKTWAGGTHPKA